MLHIDLSGLRKQLVANGYHPLPNKDKQCFVKGWSDPGFLDREISRLESWPDRWPQYIATGGRLDNRLGVIDNDADDKELSATLWGIIKQYAPKIMQDAPMRFGGGEHKAALFVRIEGEDFGAIPHRNYVRPEQLNDPDAVKHKVEIFGSARTFKGNCPRQFGIYGPHSHNADGSVAREYQWADGRGLCEVALADLPTLTKKQAEIIMKAFEDAAEELGWVPVLPKHNDKGPVTYDIDENTRFNTNRGGVGLTYDELCEQYAGFGEGLRCSSNFMPGRGGKGKVERCLIGDANRHKCVAVFVSGDATPLHFPADLAPVADGIHQKIEAAVRDLPVFSAPRRPEDSASITDKAIWLTRSYGYCAWSDSVVEIYNAADDCLLKPPAFQRLFRSWREQVTGKRGGVKFNYATAYWEVNPARVNFEGVRMRPDKPFPIYDEAGLKYKNTYLRPQHEGSGDIKPWLDYMVHLLPSPIERDWFCDWLAHKHLHPGIPGVAVIMVATGEDGPVYGAGRGILRDIISRLIGPKYVKPIDFDVFTGKSGQGVYTDWGAYATLVTVNESKDTPDAGRWTERRAVYERLREIVDPRAIERTFIRKGHQAFTGLSFASYLIFSNNRDALQIPDGDRRVAAVANGEQMKPAMADGLQKWMDQPGNIAELARWLESRDLNQFDAYKPPVTETKTIMQTLARSELDEAFDTIRRRIGQQRLFTGEQIRAAIIMELGDAMSMDTIKAWVSRRVRAEASQVGEMRMTPTEGRHKILAWRGWVNKWTGGSEAARASVHKTAEILADRSSSVVAWPAT